MEDRENRIGTGAALLLTGALIGAGVALLLAPQSGRATRNDISRIARRARRKANRAIEDLAGNVSELVAQVGEKAEEILDKGKDLTHDTKKELLSVLESGRDRLEAQRARLLKKVG
ncbi:MAG TPA: YtxH domain-containing protein [Candidatus Deferrimicrobiaceae bacterium]|jgi:gas vesicle protein